MQLQDLFPIAADLEITFPDGTATGITFKVVGQDSKQFRDAAKKIAATMLDTEGKASVDDLERQRCEMVAACVVGWTGLEEGDKPVEYSSAKAIELMSMPQLSFIRDQVEGFVNKRTNFFRERKAAA